MRLMHPSDVRSENRRYGSLPQGPRSLGVEPNSMQSQIQNRQIHPKPNRFPTTIMGGRPALPPPAVPGPGFLRGIFGCGSARSREYGLQRPMTETATKPQSKRPAGNQNYTVSTPFLPAFDGPKHELTNP